MIRTALLASALLAIPSAALAQSQTVLPEVRMLRTPAAAPTDGPPADYIQDMAPEYNGWIYQQVAAAPGSTTLYRGEGYPATIMVCPRVTNAKLFLREGPEVIVWNSRCATVTTDHLRVSSDTTTPVRIRYRILAVHRAAE